MKKNKKRFLLSVASDKKYGDFLIEHWFVSLKSNVNLKDIDILVLDYGLSLAQRFYLEQHNVIVEKFPRDGHVVVIRFRDLGKFLETHFYEQILTTDGGDIIFQDDISHLYHENTDEYRAVCENLSPAFEYFITEESFYKEDIKELKETLLFKKMINAGVILAPYEKMKYLCNIITTKTKDLNKFGPDQILLNYVLHKNGFIELESIYNFIPVTSLIDFTIKNGIFYDKNNKKIPIVHNAGNLNFFRAIDNFGYGPEHNLLKEDILKALRTLYTSLQVVNKPKKQFHLLSKKIANFVDSTMKDFTKSLYEEQKQQLEQLIKSIQKIIDNK